MIAFYKPNQAGRGCAVSFRLATYKDKPAFMMEMIRQTGQMGSPGTFKDGEKIAVKINEIELGGLLAGIESDFKQKVSLVHKFNENTTLVNFSKTEKDGKVFYSAGISRGETKFFAPLTKGEFITLREYIKWALKRMFDEAAAKQYSKVESEE